jgi:thiosulfate/3-mercaptopyruvate sulfurtransferase
VERGETADVEDIGDAPWISARLGKPGLALIDTRTDGEYLGTGDRHGMPSAGHLPGARQLEWEQLFKDRDAMVFKSHDEIAKLYADRMKAGDTVVTYCWIGQRASMTYAAARMLGLPVKFYDGSYQDWQIRKLPVVAGAKP